MAIAFYEAALGFRVRDSVHDDGALMHVEMTYQDQLIVMFAPEGAFGSTAQTPKSAATTAPQSFYLYVDDVDTVYARAIAAGADRTSLQTVDVQDMPLAYLPGNSLRVRVRVAGQIASRPDQYGSSSVSQ